jgi:hypothetical protein
MGDLRNQSLMEVLASEEAKRIERSLRYFRPPTKFCAECKGGPTLVNSMAKQALTVALDIQQRLSPTKSIKTL